MNTFATDSDPLPDTEPPSLSRRDGSPLSPSAPLPFAAPIRHLPHRTFVPVLRATALALAITATPLSAQTVNNGNMNTPFGSTANSLDLLNNGTITVYGNGMIAGDTSTLENAGTITVNSSRAYGMTAGSGSTLTNAATGTITMNQSYGYAMALTGSAGTLTNNGTITLAGSSNSGLYAANSGTAPASITLTNNGTINANNRYDVGMSGSGNGIVLINSASGQIRMNGYSDSGIVASGDNTKIVNDGQIVTSGSSGKGINIFGNGAIATNNGSIIASGDQGNAIEAGNGATVIQNGQIQVDGIWGTGILLESDSSAVNNGTITTTQEGSYGIFGSGDGISVSNAAQIANSGEYATSIALVGNSNTLTNSGILTTTGTEGYGILVNGDGNTITNTGTIQTSGTDAHGIVILGNNNTVSSTHTISVSGSGSHQLMVGNADGSATGSATVTDFALSLSPDQWNDPDNRPFGVGPGSSLTFANTRLILKPGSADSGFAFDQRYALADMTENDGTVSGTIGSDMPDAGIAGAMPMLKAHLYGGGGDPLSQQVSLSIEPEDNHGQAANSATVRRSSARLWLMNRTLGNALDTLNYTSDLAFFALPYYQHSRVTGSAASRADSGGLMVGATRLVTPALNLGWHIGLEHTSLSASDHGLSSDANAWTAGLHGRYRLRTNWHLQGQLSATVSKSHYHFRMEGDSANDERTEYGVFTHIKSQWDLPVGAHHTFSPEIGIAWAWLRNPAMDANWHNPVNTEMNLHFEKRDFSAFYGTAGLRWTGVFSHQGFTLSPSAAVGIRHNLGDGHVDSGFTFMDKHYRASLTEDRTSTNLEAGLRVSRDRFSAALRYYGEFGSHFHDHIVWAELGMRF